MLTDQLGSGETDTFGYAPRGWVQSLTSAAGSNTRYSFGLSFAPDGNIKSGNDSVNGNWNYTYDDFNRLLTANATGQAYNYVYDRFGNRWQQNGPVPKSLTFDANNRIPAGSGYTYDLAGNLTADGSHTYTYDGEGRILWVDSGSTAQYVYDADGKRVRKITSGAAVDYIYDASGTQVAEFSSTGAWNRGEVYAGGRHLATYSGGTSGTTYFVHSDWLGTERARTDKSGNPYETCTSLPFGDSQTCTGSDPSPMHFTGKERDSETGLDYFDARYYGLNMGRFMSPDPLGGHNEDPQTLNRYSYVRNNPLSLTDPTGLDFNLQCTQTKDNASTCQGGVAGTTTTDANGKSTFTATVVTSASLQDQNSGNTATVNENGVQITTGGQTYQGSFISNTPAADIQGSGQLTDFSFHIDGNCGGSCSSSGEWSYHGSLNDARSLLNQRGSFTIPLEDARAGIGLGAHPFSTQHRFGGSDCTIFSCPNSPHLSVAYQPGTSNYVAAVKQEPKANVPQSSSGGFHVDAHADWAGHAKDVSGH